VKLWGHLLNMESQTKRAKCEVLEFWKQLNVRIQTL
jgi:hypothetical protein